METFNLSGGLLLLFLLLFIWELVWKLAAMWKAARNDNKGWYICPAVINTAGILPIIYILMNRNKSAAHS